MPVALSYPGVYIEEVSSGVRTIVGVSTSITAFVGLAKSGPTNDPKRLQSFADYQRIFGELDVKYMLGYAVQQFFANGGSDAVVIRVAPADATAASVEFNAPPEGETTKKLTLEAKGEGTWANSLEARVDHETKQPSTAQLGKLFNLHVRNTTTNVVEEFRNVSVDRTDPRYVVAVLEDESTLVRVKNPTDLPSKAPISPTDPFDDTVASRFTTATAAASPSGRAKISLPGGLSIESKKVGTDGNSLRASVSNSNATAKTFDLRVMDTATGARETHLDLSVDNAAPRFVTNVLAAQSALVQVQGTVTDAPPTAHTAVPAITFTRATPGVDGTGAPDVIGSSNDPKKGMHALDKISLFNLLCLPPLGRDDETPPEVYAKALEYCIRKRAMLIIDSPKSWTTIDSAERGVDGIRSALGADNSKNAALYFPRLKMADPLRENRTAEFVPCGAIAGIMAKTDANRGVWKAPAGIEAGIAGVRDFTVKMTDPENGRLNPLGVNCLRNFPVYGNLVWGARTLAGADQLTSEWKYIPIRRLTLFLEESLYRGTQWVVFEPNDEPLWAQIRLNVGAFMQGLFRQGAFQGRTSREAYFVRCDKTTTTQDDINKGIVNIEVGFAPLKPAEFVVIKIQQIAGNIET